MTSSRVVIIFISGPTCPATINVTSAGENLTSPGYPSFYDPVNLLCTLYRILPENDEALLLVFNVFSVDQYYSCEGYACCRDYVQAWSTVVGNIVLTCSAGFLNIQILTNTELLLDLNRLGTVESQGFHATLEAYDRNDCGGHFIAGNGNITSPSYPSNYPDRSICVYEIRAADTSRDVLLHFVDFQLEAHSNCIWDRIKVRHVFPNGTTGEMTVCGSTLPADVIAKTISVLFYADYSENRRGFRAAYSVYQPPTIAPVTLLDEDVELVNRNQRAEATTQNSSSMTTIMPIEAMMSTYITPKTNVESRHISLGSTVIYTEEIPNITDISTGTVAEPITTVFITDVRSTFADISTQVNPELIFMFTEVSSISTDISKETNSESTSMLREISSTFTNTNSEPTETSSSSTEVLTETSSVSTSVPIKTSSDSTDISTETILEPTKTSSPGNSTEVISEATLMPIGTSSSLTDTLANTILDTMAFLERSLSSTEISTEPSRENTVMRTESVSSSTYTSTEKSVTSPIIPIDESLHVMASLTEMTLSYMPSATKISTESNLETSTANTLSVVVSRRVPAETGELDSPTDGPGLFSSQSAITSPTQSAIASPTQSAITSPTQSATASPTQSAITSPTQSAIASATQLAITSLTQSAITSPTQSAIASPTNSSSTLTTDAFDPNVTMTTSQAQPQCPPLPPIPNANVIYSVGVGFPLENGTVAVVDCPEGYRLNTRQDNVTLVCLDSLAWNLTANIICESE
ncbi:mucin-5AC [Lingula anatina]|uniref:Mucin-5AC n=1 Tax=Lingula anatina TaxID=7574 RepID=A0A1S3H7K5_LINAN|nr:mucin-5AC [Lingula anatina]|eukprot:XP_013382095.1 mucin-5AC [Lingula anatina]